LAFLDYKGNPPSGKGKKIQGRMQLNEGFRYCPDLHSWEMELEIPKFWNEIRSPFQLDLGLLFGKKMSWNQIRFKQLLGNNSLLCTACSAIELSTSRLAFPIQRFAL